MQLRNNSALQNGKYRIIRVLGQGGFGITYLAENVLLDKKVAIKEFFPKEYCDRDSTSRLTLGTQNNAETVSKLMDRFLKEAKNIAKLDHPGIIRIHDVFEENNTAYYVMDYIEGENLNEMVKRIGPLSEAKAIEYIRKVGDALDYIHSRNMTHFDVKPANIVVRREDDQPVLIDFGLSKQYNSNGDATSTLMQGVSNGYSPIELYNIGSIQTWSPETDIYSLAATMFFMVTGNTPPYSCDVRDNPDMLHFPSGLSKSVCNGIKNVMTVAKTNRIKTVQIFINSLIECHSSIEENTYILNDDKLNRSISTPSFKNKSKRNNRADIPKSSILGKIVSIIGLIIIFIGIGVWVYFYNEEKLFNNEVNNQLLPIPINTIKK